MSAAPEEHHRAVRGARLRPERGGWALPGLLALGLHVAMLMVPLTRPAAREHRALAPVAVRLQPAPRPTEPALAAGLAPAVTRAPSVPPAVAPVPAPKPTVAPVPAPTPPAGPASAPPARVVMPRAPPAPAEPIPPPAPAESIAPPAPADSIAPLAPGPPASTEPVAPPRPAGPPAPPTPPAAPALPSPPPAPQGPDLGPLFRAVRAEVEAQQRYPRRAQRLGQQGTAVISVRLTRAGALAEAPVLLRSSGHALLDAEALRMVEAAAPFPGLPAGYTADTVALELPVRFSL